MWSIRGTGGKELTIMICCAVFSKRNFPNQNTKEANRWYVYLMVVVSWGDGKLWTTTAAYLLYHYSRDLHPHRGHSKIHTTRHMLPGLQNTCAGTTAGVMFATAK